MHSVSAKGACLKRHNPKSCLSRPLLRPEKHRGTDLFNSPGKSRLSVLGISGWLHRCP